MTTTIAKHSTQAGFAIAIIKVMHWGRKVEIFQVIRVAPGNAYVVLDSRDTEVEARELANTHWSVDRA